MVTHKIFRAIQPYIAAVAVVAITAVLVFTIYFTEHNLPWVAFLAGILMASILALATRASHTEWLVLRRTAQLAALKEKLEDERQLRLRAEIQYAADQPRLHLIDEAIPAMVALVDADLCYRYHNRAFRNWLHLRPEQINGQPMRKMLGGKVYAEMEDAVRQSLKGNAARYKLTLKTPHGATYLLTVEHVPQFARDGKVSGFYFLAADITERGNLPSAQTSREPVTPSGVHGGESEQDMFAQSFTEQMSGRKDVANQIMEAIEKDEFHLLCQLITPLPDGSVDPVHYEILIRLMGEEDNLMPPGAFFPLAESLGLMPRLDRWVVQHVAEWISNKNLQGRQFDGSIFFINLASDTINDPEFPGFLQQQLLKYGVPAAALCFEILGSAAIAGEGAAKFSQQVRQLGCHTALSGFGRDGVSFELLRNLRVDFLKIDGSVIPHILRDPIYLDKVLAINQVAKKIGIKTIAELVESEEIIIKLREIGIDSAQGFGISQPRLLEKIE